LSWYSSGGDRLTLSLRFRTAATSGFQETIKKIGDAYSCISALGPKVQQRSNAARLFDD
jgi:hypothetical protein